jgi:hypothetical protein
LKGATLDRESESYPISTIKPMYVSESNQDRIPVENTSLPTLVRESETINPNEFLNTKKSYMGGRKDVK